MLQNEQMKHNRKEAAKRRKRKQKILVLFLAAVAIIAGVYALPPALESGDLQQPETVPAEDAAAMPEEAVSLSLVCVGDIMVHKPQIASQYDSKSGTYNYDNNFEYVKSYIEDADLALCNVETTFAGGTPSGYPSFNAPDALADALENTGFDVAVTSNNHLYDKGFSGMKRTLHVLRNAGLATSGTRLPWEKNYTMVEVNGLKIAVIAYTYETPSSSGRTTINSAFISEEAEPLINSFNYETLDEDLKKVEASISEAEGEGADLVVCYYHWGEEYQRSPNQWQKYIAQQTVNMGADVIFGSHAHVLQSVDMLTNEETGQEVPVFYSMGNFLSNQRTETLNNRYTEQGMIARVNIEFMKSRKEIVSVEMDAMRSWVDKYFNGKKDVYAIIPLDENIEENEVLKASGHLNRAIQASEDITAVIGDNYVWK